MGTGGRCPSPTHGARGWEWGEEGTRRDGGCWAQGCVGLSRDGMEVLVALCEGSLTHPCSAGGERDAGELWGFHQHHWDSISTIAALPFLPPGSPSILMEPSISTTVALHKHQWGPPSIPVELSIPTNGLPQCGMTSWSLNSALRLGSSGPGAP